MILDLLEKLLCEPRLDDPSSVLLRMPGSTNLRVKDTFEGIACIGSTGSGKTSAALSLKQALLRHGYGLLIACVKPTEAEEWQQVIADCGRSHDLILFSPGSQYRFDPIETEPSPAEAAALLQDLNSVLHASSATSENSTFWKTESSKVMRHAFTIVLHALGRIDWNKSSQVIASHASDLEQTHSKAWQERSVCYRLLCLAQQRSPRDEDLKRSIDFWLSAFPGYDPKTRANVVGVTANLLEKFQYEPLRSLFSGPSICSPQDILNKGKIVIVDLPVLTDRLTGTIANSIWLYSFCRALTKRTTTHPCAIWIDEAQFLLTEEMMQIQSIIRSHSVSTILLFQNISVLQERLSKVAVTGLLGNINTLIFSRQSDAETRQWAADRIGKIKKIRKTRNYGTTQSKGGGSSFSLSKEEVWDYRFQPDNFSALKTGGPSSGFKVETIVLSGDRAFRAKWHQLQPGSAFTVKPNPKTN